jgi:hypothetical protein
MTAYAVRAVPWARIVLAAGLVILLMELVRWNPWILWPLEGTAVGLLAGAAAWCVDEEAAAVVDGAPRGLAWRTAARAPGILLLAGVWAATVWHARASLFDHASVVLLQGLAALAAGTAWATSRRAAGAPMPGLAFAATVIPTATGWALVRPLAEQLPVFPYGTTTTGQATASLVGWTLLGVVSLGVTALELAEVRWWRGRGHDAASGRRARTQIGVGGRV